MEKIPHGYYVFGPDGTVNHRSFDDDFAEIAQKAIQHPEKKPSVPNTIPPENSSSPQRRILRFVRRSR